MAAIRELLDHSLEMTGLAEVMDEEKDSHGCVALGAVKRIRKRLVCA
jgi:hypothetical protein